MTNKVNIKLQDITEYEGETYYRIRAEYFPKEPNRASAETHFVQLGESFDLAVPPVELSQPTQELLGRSKDE